MILVIYGLVCWYILLIYEILKYWVGIKALFVLICVLCLGKGQAVKTCEGLATRFEFFLLPIFFSFGIIFDSLWWVGNTCNSNLKGHSTKKRINK